MYPKCILAAKLSLKSPCNVLDSIIAYHAWYLNIDLFVYIKSIPVPFCLMLQYLVHLFIIFYFILN